MTETVQAKRSFRTVSDVLNMPAGESEPIIMRAAPAIGRVVEAVGLLDVFFDSDFATYQSAREMAKLSKKERERVTEHVLSMGKGLTAALLTKGLGECLPDVKEIIAAVNGLTLAELNANYSTLEIIAAAKALLKDEGFLSLARGFMQ